MDSVFGPYPVAPDPQGILMILRSMDGLSDSNIVSSCWIPGILAPLTGSMLSSSGLPMSSTLTSPEAGAGVAVTTTSTWTCSVWTTTCVSTTRSGVAGACGAHWVRKILQRTNKTNAFRICDFIRTPPSLWIKSDSQDRRFRETFQGQQLLST